LIFFAFHFSLRFFSPSAGRGMRQQSQSHFKLLGPYLNVLTFPALQALLSFGEFRAWRAVGADGEVVPGAAHFAGGVFGSVPEILEGAGGTLPAQRRRRT
jgi:hypothetical protein